MQSSTDFNTTSYHNDENNTIQLLNVNDIVKVNNNNLIIIEHSNNTYTGQDIHGNKIPFFIDDIEKVIFDSSSQLTINETINKSKLQTLKDSLLDVELKLKNTFISLTNVKTLKELRIKLKEQIKELEPKKEYKQLSLL